VVLQDETKSTEHVSALKKSKETPDRLRAALSKYSHLLC